MGKLRPETVEWLASGHAERPRLFQNLLLFLWALLNCVLGLSAQGPGEWTPWVSWTRCSSSCGRGVSVRSRRCLWLPGEEPCWGDSHEYRLCQLPDCPPGAVPFRDLQCALYNGRPVLGTQKIYQWVPFYGAPSQCDLNCLAEGHTFYHSFGRVLDGTACSPGAQGVCVAGRCLSAGCDGLLGSGALEDRCGRCGGANDSCLFVQRVFRDAGAFSGYWNVTLIPEGARHLRVAHRSRNHLGILGSDGGGSGQPPGDGASLFTDGETEAWGGDPRVWEARWAPEGWLFPCSADGGRWALHPQRGLGSQPAWDLRGGRHACGLHPRPRARGDVARSRAHLRRPAPAGATGPPRGSSCRSPTRASSLSSGSPGNATTPSRRGRRPWAGPCGSLSPGRWSHSPPQPPLSPLHRPHPWPQTPAHPVPTPEAAPTDCFTIAPVTLSL
ncbi:ADAMTS-like protein 5 isoform X12 [Callithrix jacchus]|uniref:ADAMTS-like protein 5 isoform X7 n=1 Tax=Callithrix jacchus TaxID=9483 RepID=UPI0023DD5D99|nr:ADAMTS-like protein 5 isoform X7 [Callithrix jacchus]